MDTLSPQTASPLLQRIPEPVRDTLSPEQAQALSQVTNPAGQHPVDLRLTLPLPGRKVFFSVVAGRERRSGERLAVERRQHPLHTAGNILFMLTSLAGFYALALFATLMIGSVVKF
ncbi:MAG: hypothetical protein HOJ90_07370 [Alphaproteobacteria bacterium]|jgi:hypothetical protein|nr:hypothetical protein [Alphaproteobacteria bacterium]